MKRKIGSVLLALAAAALFAAYAPAHAGEAKAGEDGFTIAETDEFSLEMHFLFQTMASTSQDRYRFEGDLYSWFNLKKAQSGQVFRVDIPNRNDTVLPEEQSFRVRRAWVTFGGRAFYPWLHWEAEFEGFGDNEGPELLQAFVRLGDPQRYSATIGQFKVPFDMFQLAPEWKRLFPEASTVSQSVTPEYDLGAMFSARSEDGRWLARAAFQNGSGRNESNSDDSVETTLRLEFQNEGGFDYDLSPIGRSESTQYTFGAAYTRDFAGQRIDSETGRFCFEGLSLDCTESPNLADGVELFGALRLPTLQLNASFQSWKLRERRNVIHQDLPTSEDTLLSASDVSLSPEDQKALMLRLEGALLIGKNLEAVARFARIEEDDFSFSALPFGPSALAPPLVEEPRPDLVAAKETAKDFSLGVNYYLRKHNLKLQVSWTAAEVEDEIRDDLLSYAFHPDNINVRRPFYSRKGKIFREDEGFIALLTFYL